MMDRQDRQNSETERHRTTLLGLLALIFVYAGLADDTRSAMSTERVRRAMSASPEAWTLSRRICRRLLLLIRPVEAATRRLIVVLASGLPLSEAPTTTVESFHAASAHGAGHASPKPQGDGETPHDREVDRAPRFALADPVKRYEWFFSGKPHDMGWKGPAPASPDDELDAAGILRRIAALARALDDLEAQARRLARWRSRRMRAGATGRRLALSPLRPGNPPGSLPLRAPKKARREEHELLCETHALARAALARLDTS
jgi:hypothetical protein